MKWVKEGYSKGQIIFMRLIKPPFNQSMTYFFEINIHRTSYIY
jgi:hypothetical protein